MSASYDWPEYTHDYEDDYPHTMSAYDSDALRDTFGYEPMIITSDFDFDYWDYRESGEDF